MKILFIDTNLGYSIYPASKLVKAGYDVDYHIYCKETFPSTELKLLGVGTGITKLDILPSTLKDYNIIFITDSGFDGLFLYSDLINKKYFGFSCMESASNLEYNRYEFKAKLQSIISQNMIDTLKVPEFFLFQEIKELEKILMKNKDKSFWIKPNTNIRFESFKINYKVFKSKIKDIEKLFNLMYEIKSAVYVEEDVSDKGTEIGGECVLINGKPNGIYMIGTEGDEKKNKLTFSDITLGYYFSKLAEYIYPSDFNGIVSVEGIVNKKMEFYVFETNVRLSQPTSLQWFYIFEDFIEFSKIDFTNIFNRKLLYDLINPQIRNKIFKDGKFIGYLYAKQVWNRKIGNFSELNIEKSLKLKPSQTKDLLPQSYYIDKDGNYIFLGKRIGLKILKP